MSFAGSWFGTYARSRKDAKYDFAGQTARSLRRKHDKIRGVEFLHADYRDLDPGGRVVYCDPPYAGTAGYKAVGDFDSEEFWQTMFEWAKEAGAVLVSEFSAPDDPGIEVLWELERKVMFGEKADGTYPTNVDRLYRVWP